MDAQENSSELLKIPKPGLKHYGMAGGIVAAIYMLAPVKTFFFTREEGSATVQRVEKLERAQEQFNTKLMEIPTRTELTEMLNKTTDRILQFQTERDARTNSRMDSLEQTVDRRLNLLLQDRNNNNRGK